MHPYPRDNILVSLSFFVHNQVHPESLRKAKRFFDKRLCSLRAYSP